MPLTDSAIKKAKPEAKQRKLYDERGFFLLISPKSASGGGLSISLTVRKNCCRSARTPM